MMSDPLPPAPKPSGTYGQAVLVALNWHLAVVGVLFVLILSQSGEEPAGCAGFGCFSPRMVYMWLGTMVALPAMLGTFLLSAVTALLLVRRMQSAFAVGTVAAGTAMALGCCVAIGFLSRS